MIVYEESKVVNCDCRGQGSLSTERRMEGLANDKSPCEGIRRMVCVVREYLDLKRGSVFDLGLPEYFFKVFWLLRGYC